MPEVERVAFTDAKNATKTRRVRTSTRFKTINERKSTALHVER
jgi:hypothetical protein